MIIISKVKFIQMIEFFFISMIPKMSLIVGVGK